MKFFYNQSDYLNQTFQFIANKDELNWILEGNSASSNFSWYWIKAIEIDRLGTLVINIGGVNAIALPKETFENDEQKQQVFNQLTTWHNNAKTAFT